MKFKNFINEQIGNKLIFKATRKKRSSSGFKIICFYKKPDGSYFRWEGHKAKSDGGMTKEGMTLDQIKKEIKAFDVVADRFDIENHLNEDDK